jgi:hypothetical protein
VGKDEGYSEENKKVIAIPFDLAKAHETILLLNIQPLPPPYELGCLLNRLVSGFSFKGLEVKKSS